MGDRGQKFLWRSSTRLKIGFIFAVAGWGAGLGGLCCAEALPLVCWWLEVSGFSDGKIGQPVLGRVTRVSPPCLSAWLCDCDNAGHDNLGERAGDKSPSDSELNKIIPCYF